MMLCSKEYIQRKVHITLKIALVTNYMQVKYLPVSLSEVTLWYRQHFLQKSKKYNTGIEYREQSGSSVLQIYCKQMDSVPSFSRSQSIFKKKDAITGATLVSTSTY
jgi:hypothetical protein